MWPDVGVKSSPKFPKSCSKSSTCIRVRFFKIAQKVGNQNGYICEFYCLPEISKIAQCGHTGQREKMEPKSFLIHSARSCRWMPRDEKGDENDKFRRKMSKIKFDFAANPSKAIFDLLDCLKTPTHKISLSPVLFDCSPLLSLFLSYSVSYKCDQTRFAEISPLWQFFTVYFLLGKMLSLLWQFVKLLGKFSLLKMAKY